MPEALQPALDRLRADLLDADRLVRAVASGHRRGERPRWRKVELRVVDLRDGRRLQVVTYDDRQAFTRNVPPADAGPEVDALLAEPFGHWYVDTVERVTQLRVTKRGEAQVHVAARPEVVSAGEPVREHDRLKPRLLDPADPFLVAVGISDAAGRVKPSRQDKYRQVEELLRALQPVLPAARAAAGDGPLRVADLGCGNAYLTFAAYRMLTVDGDEPELVGVDVKAQARERNTALAAQLGLAGARFVEGAIGEVELAPPPHLVLALHACDTATDEALARAVQWQAPVVLAAPCCHHDLQRQLRTARDVPAPYGLLARHGILRERFADALTDGLRAALLRMAGYRVDVVEFVDSVHTPRNVLLRAVHTGAAPALDVVTDYLALTRQWGVEPALERLLRGLLPALPDSAA